LPPPGTTVSWELIDSPDAASRIANGELAGRSLSELVAQTPTQLIGNRHRPGRPFPFCIRLVEATTDQPLAVHPDGDVDVDGVRYTRNNKFWYALAHKPRARIIAGITHTATRMRILQRLDTPELDELLQSFETQDYDAFFAPNGRVHCLGRGNLVWELQQRPAPPLRISAWTPHETIPEDERESGLRAVYFQDRQLPRITGDASPLTHTRRIPILPHCPSFMVEEIRLYDHLFDRTSPASFHLVAQIDGRTRVEADTASIMLERGEVALLPAGLGDYRMYADSGQARLLRVMLRN
jgi:mannose-6-phosphate isomerase